MSKKTILDIDDQGLSLVHFFDKNVSRRFCGFCCFWVLPAAVPRQGLINLVGKFQNFNYFGKNSQIIADHGLQLVIKGRWFNIDMTWSENLPAPQQQRASLLACTNYKLKSGLI